MSRIELEGEVVYPMGRNTRALRLDDATEARRFRDWCSGTGITTKIATVTSITGPDDGGVPLVYFGAERLVARCSSGDHAAIVVESRNRRTGRGIETTDLRLL